MEAKVSDIYLHLSATTCNIFLDVADMIMKDGQVGVFYFLKYLGICLLAREGRVSLFTGIPCD